MCSCVFLINFESIFFFCGTKVGLIYKLWYYVINYWEVENDSFAQDTNCLAITIRMSINTRKENIWSDGQRELYMFHYLLCFHCKIKLKKIMTDPFIIRYMIFSVDKKKHLRSYLFCKPNNDKINLTNIYL